LARLRCQACFKMISGQLTQVAGLVSMQGHLPMATGGRGGCH
jgi:hypothetical protein